MSLFLSRSCTSVAPPAATMRASSGNAWPPRVLGIDDRVEPQIEFVDHRRRFTRSRDPRLLDQRRAVERVDGIEHADRKTARAGSASRRDLAGDAEDEQAATRSRARRRARPRGTRRRAPRRRSPWPSPWPSADRRWRCETSRPSVDEMSVSPVSPTTVSCAVSERAPAPVRRASRPASAVEFGAG